MQRRIPVKWSLLLIVLVPIFFDDFRYQAGEASTIFIPQSTSQNSDLEERLAELESKVKRMEDQIQIQSGQIESFNLKIDSISTTFSGLSTRLDEVLSGGIPNEILDRLDAMQAEIADLKIAQGVLKNQADTLSTSQLASSNFMQSLDTRIDEVMVSSSESERRAAIRFNISVTLSAAVLLIFVYKAVLQ